MTARVKLLINARAHLLNAEGDLGYGLNGRDDECRVTRGACGSLIWGGLITETCNLDRVSCKRCRRTGLFTKAAS